MNIIYTFCNPENRATKPSEFLHNCAVLSSGSVKKFTNYNTVLYIDPKQYRWFKDIPYFDNIIKVDYFEDNFDTRYWNYPKLKTYSLQESPFCHIDLDMVVMPGFNVPSDSDFVTERFRSIKNEKSCFRHALSAYSKPSDIICSGIIGCNDVNAMHVFDDIYSKAKIECANGVNETVEFQDLYSIEEVALSQIVFEEQWSVKEIPVSKYIHFQGKNKETIYGNEVKRLMKNFKL